MLPSLMLTVDRQEQGVSPLLPPVQLLSSFSAGGEAGERHLYYPCFDSIGGFGDTYMS